MQYCVHSLQTTITGIAADKCICALHKKGWIPFKTIANLCVEFGQFIDESKTSLSMPPLYANLHQNRTNFLTGLETSIAHNFKSPERGIDITNPAGDHDKCQKKLHIRPHAARIHLFPNFRYLICCIIATVSASSYGSTIESNRVGRTIFFCSFIYFEGFVGVTIFGQYANEGTKRGRIGSVALGLHQSVNFSKPVNLPRFATSE